MSYKAWEHPLNEAKCVVCGVIEVSPHPMDTDTHLCGECFGEKWRAENPLPPEPKPNPIYFSQEG